MPGLTIGTAAAKPGRITTGWLDHIPLPSGDADRFPVMIAQGKSDGPVFWVTTGIHGTEHTGPIVVHELMTAELVRSLRGTVIAIPTLNPSGLRTKQRGPYYGNGDPNRLFPKPGQVLKKPGTDERPLSDLELAYARLYDVIVETHPVGLLDLHNASIGSIPFSLRDPVFFYTNRGKSPSQQRATALQARLGELARAIGLTAINEYAADSYAAQNLDRSVSGSILNGAGIPALTIELGSWMHVDPGIVQACLAGLRNALRWAGLLDGSPEPIEGVPVVKPSFAVRRADSVYAPETGIVHHLVRPGEMFSKGQPLARMTDVFGGPIAPDDGLVRATADGFVYGWSHGVVRYRGETIMTLAIRDTEEMLVPYRT